MKSVLIKTFLNLFKYEISAGMKKQKSGKYPLAVTVIVKNEEDYIEEWIEYHKAAGVSHIFLYDNDSTDSTPEIVKKYVRRGFVSYYRIQGSGRQFDAYNASLAMNRRGCRYMAFIDADEFLLSLDSGKSLYRCVDDIFREIRKKDKKVGGLAVNWAMFGSSGLKKKPQSGGVTENFLYRARAGRPGTDCIKTILDPKCVIGFFHPHFPLYKPGFHSVDEDGNIVKGYSNKCADPKKIRINHYFTKSEEEWIKRRALGKADKSGGGDKRTLDEFHLHDNNDIYDDYILQVMKKGK